MVEQIAALAEGINMVWVLTVTFLIFFMHAGFAMLESGQVRSKNVANQLTKNMLTWAIGIVVFFFVGMGIANLTGALTGSGEFGSLAMFDAGPMGWVDWLFSAVFAMTAATIVSGAVAGRARLRAYVTYTFVLAAIIYPVVAGLGWYGGFLGETLGFHDFAGGMIVHGVGGIAGLTAAWIIGPRLGRFDDDGTPNVIPGHSMTFAVLGTLVLCFGWYGFNVGTAASVVVADGSSFVLDDFAYVGRVAMATTLGMTMGALGAGAVALWRTGKVDTLFVANGMLAGLVGVTGTADLLTPMGALVLGGLAGAQLPIVFEFVEKRMNIDDVCAVFPVHGSAGVLGIVLYPLFSSNGTPIGDGLVAEGILSIEAEMFAPQIIGVLIITIWTVGATAIVWGAFRAVGQARVTPEHERDGLDVSEHGVDTYPEFGGPDLVTDGGRTLPDGGRLLPDGGRTLPDGGRSLPDGGRSLPDGGKTPEGGELKMVTAIVRPERLSAVKRSLADVGAPSLTVTNVSGRGSQPAKKGQWRGEEYVVDLHQKVKIECVVAEIPAADVVDAIRDAANTGEPGDGKIFVIPVEDAVQVRTGTSGLEAV